MKALVKYQAGRGGMEIRDVPEPEPREGEAVLKVLAGGVCGSDLHFWKGEWEWKRAVVVGHELVGEIVALGEKVQGYQVGRLVVPEVHHSWCKACSYCLTGFRHLCPHKEALGLEVDGGFAEYVRVPADLLHPIPPELNPLSAVLAEPTAIAVCALMEKAGLAFTDRVAVIGPGPVGILSAQVARAAGAEKVVVLGTGQDMAVRLKICQELGFTTYNVEETGPEDILEQENGGEGMDVVVEASGSSAGVQLAIALTKKNSRLVAVGIPGQPLIPVPWARIVHHALTIAASYSSSFTSWEKAISLIARGELKTRPLVSHQGPLDKWEEIFLALDRGEGVKGVLIP